MTLGSFWEIKDSSGIHLAMSKRTNQNKMITQTKNMCPKCSDARQWNIKDNMVILSQQSLDVVL